MPRPKQDPNALYIRELRITPPDGKPIEDWKMNSDDFKVAIIAEEGGTQDVRLHYHAYVECRRSASWLTKWIYSVAHCYNQETGNTVFFTRAPHENTIGYVVKDGKIVCRHGCSDSYIDEWLNKSDQYKRDKEAKRQRTKRDKKAFTQEVLDTVVAAVRTDSALRTPRGVLNLILAEFATANRPYPTRTQVETLVVTILHPYDEYLVRDFYLRSFENNRY